MTLVEIILLCVGLPIIFIMAWAVDKKEDKEDYFNLSDDDF